MLALAIAGGFLAIFTLWVIRPRDSFDSED